MMVMKEMNVRQRLRCRQRLRKTRSILFEQRRLASHQWAHLLERRPVELQAQEARLVRTLHRIMQHLRAARRMEHLLLALLEVTMPVARKDAPPGGPKQLMRAGVTIGTCHSATLSTTVSYPIERRNDPALTKC